MEPPTAADRADDRLARLTTLTDACTGASASPRAGTSMWRPRAALGDTTLEEARQHLDALVDAGLLRRPHRALGGRGGLPVIRWAGRCLLIPIAALVAGAERPVTIPRSPMNRARVKRVGVSLPAHTLMSTQRSSV
jgi:hypothetical protein